MLHLRMVAAPERVADVLAALERDEAVANIVHIAGAGRKPYGDLVLCDVAREEASVLIRELREVGGNDLSIAGESVDVSISEAARRAEEAAPGMESDAVVWEEVEARTSESAELSASFLGFMALATMLAAVGILTDSQILIIGAMVLGPEFGPLAGLCVALVERRRDLARRSFRALAVGFPVAIVASLALTAALRVVALAPEELDRDGGATLFISHPNWYSVIVALIAGVAGVLSLTSAKSGALIGVLISVTTIPAAANIGVAVAYDDWNECGGAAAQLGINLSCLAAAALVTLAVQRAEFVRRLRRRGLDGDAVTRHTAG